MFGRFLLLGATTVWRRDVGLYVRCFFLFDFSSTYRRSIFFQYHARKCVVWNCGKSVWKKKRKSVLFDYRTLLAWAKLRGCWLLESTQTGIWYLRRNVVGIERKMKASFTTDKVNYRFICISQHRTTER